MSEPAPTRELTLDDLDRFLGLEVESTEDLAGHLDAAAVLAAFDPFRLRPVGEVADDAGTSLLDRLLPRCEPITQGPGRGLWSLSLPDRRVALRRLATRERMRQALQANPDRPDMPLQQMFESVVEGEQIELEHASREELAALFTVHDWLEGILEDLPDRAAIGRALAKFDMLAPMRRLAGDDFVGRVSELDQLQQYVFGREADQNQEDPLAPGTPASLFVYGPGGVGKSTLLAHFILENVKSNDLRIIYIDIDRPTIRPERPATLLLDAVKQLQPQLEVDAGAVDGLVTEISYSIGSQDAERTFESPPRSGARVKRGAIYGSPYLSQLQQFRDVFAPAVGGFVVLVVVDTFEEAQFLGTDVVGPLVQFLLDFARSFPNLRLVLSGRTLPEEYLALAFPHAPLLLPEGVGTLDQIPMPHRPINLGVLDEQSARDLLLKVVEQADVPRLSTNDLDDVIGVVGRNPMCLKLAARLLRDEGIDRLRASRSEFLSRLKAEKIQALLYGRILRHLHTEDVRAVAHPGLVVRRITPDVIRDVLAEPCGLKLTPERNEHTIFDALWNEVALVEVDREDRSLRHRVDVRRAMLEDLTDHVPLDVIERIDRGAVEFYANRSDPVSRAEEIYHRLRLRELAATLDARWMPEAASRLKNAGEELPAQQRLWLAQKLGVTLDESVRRAASQEEWEDQAARSADRYLQSREPELALNMLQERPARLPRSKLYFLEAEAHRSLDRPDAALDVARRGVDAALSVGAVDMALELLLQMVVIEEGRGNIESAARMLEEAGGVASHSSNDVLRFRVAVTRLRLHRQLHPNASEESCKLRREALGGLTDELLHAIRARPVLLREAAAELAEDDPRLASAAIEMLGVEVASDIQAQVLGQAIASLDDAQLSEVSLDRDFVEGWRQKYPETGFVVDAVRTWATQTVTSRDVRRLGTTLATVEPGTEVLRNFRTYFRAGVDSSLRSLQVRIAEAVQEFDWAAVTRLAGSYAGLVRATNELNPDVLAVLKLLLTNLQYEAVMDIADAALAIAPNNRTIRRHYAQALVDQGRIAPALSIYTGIANDPAASANDHAEARGGLGRCYKQLSLTTADSGRRAEYLQRALKEYGELYRADPNLYWHGINVAALAAYAARKSITIPGIADPAQLARDTAAEVLTTVADLQDPWAAVTACEAHVARGEVEEAVLQARVFVAHPATQASMIASFLRQLRDVWQLPRESPLGITLLPLLRQALVGKSGGTVTLTSEDVTAARLDKLENAERADPETGLQLEKVLGVDRARTLQWWRTGLLQCRAVVRIDDLNGVGRGTGFLIKGSDLHASLPELVVITNAHVVPEAIHPEDAVVAFHGLDADQAGSKASFNVRRLWWSSPSGAPGVDTTLLELDGLPNDVAPVPLVDRLPVLNDTTRVYIIGHPKGYDQPQFSIQDNLLLDYDNTRLHYRSPAEGGSSGSPVFEDHWKVIGLHHAGSPTMSRLNGKGTYPANEALRIDAIRAAIAEKPPKPENM